MGGAAAQIMGACQFAIFGADHAGPFGELAHGRKWADAMPGSDDPA
ncbi:hypothetical protein J5277_22895 [Rhizobium sp. 16-449-1b]|nr:hypothetical protein [Rhizobium sp. 16-449-1b]MBO9196965.1 hypothetical protein [Rhizobium sp. 16-449-1b]